MAEPDKIHALTAMLHEIGATPRVAPERVVRSTLYDLDYHLALVACAFAINAVQRTDGTSAIVAHWLKLLQFVAVRPALLPDVQRWAKGRLHPDVDAWQAMPRGYLGDRTHDRTVEYLIATGALHRMPDGLQSGPRFDILQQLHADVVMRDVLVSERRVLKALTEIQVNKTMLKGQ